MYETIDTDSLGIQGLERLLDRAKSEVFMGKTAAFLGSIMCSLEFLWTREIPTAATDGLKLYWNPDFFAGMSSDNRKAVLMHELWHVARLHGLRLGSRCPDKWNEACDYVINNDLKDEGYIFDGIGGLFNPDYKGMSEEEVYDLLDKPGGGGSTPSMADGIGKDLLPMNDADQYAVINTVVTAIHQSKLAKEGNLPGNIEEIVEAFLAPVVPWQTLLSRFFTQLQDEDYTWARPNRRYQDIYLPSRFTDDGRLEKIRYYIDVSGSITRNDVIRVTSELKYVKDTFNPEELTIVQFDTIIQQVDTWGEDDPFDKINIIGRGGTSLVPVREDINKSKPTAVIIFSDLECDPMEALNYDIPVIWIVVRNANIPVPFGDKICIHE